MKISNIFTIYFGFSNIIPIHANDEIIPVAIGNGGKDLKGRKLSKKNSKKNSKKCRAQSSKSADSVSAVYTMTNSGNGNEIAVFERNIHTGTLKFKQTVSTGGDGGRLGLPDGSVAPVDNPLSSTNAITVAGKLSTRCKYRVQYSFIHPYQFQWPFDFGRSTIFRRRISCIISRK